MKKILSIFLVVLTLLTFAVPTFAAESTGVDITKSSVEDDLKLWRENYDDEFPINPNDTDIYLLHMQEYGYSSNGKTDKYALYFYIYNPSQKIVSRSDYNKIQLASVWKDYVPVKYSKYSLSIVNASEDERFVKLKLDAASYKSNNFFIQNSDRSRSYTVSGIELRSEYNELNSSNTGDYTVGYTFTFSGYSTSNNLSCKRSDFTVIELNVHQTSYLTGDSGRATDKLENGFYSNQVNSVYFSIPQKYENTFGNLYSIDYEYYQYRTAPIILVDNQNDFNNLDIYLNQNLSQMSKFNYKFYDKLYEDPYVGQIQFGYYWGTKKTTLIPGTYVYNKYPEIGTYQDYYTVLLKCSNVSDRTKVLISSYELQQYFGQYGVKMGGNEMVNRSGKYIGSNNYWGDLFDLDFFGQNYFRREVFIDDNFSLPSLADTLPDGVNGFFSNWKKYGWDVAWNTDEYDNTLENIKYIEKVTKGNIPSSDSDAAQKFLVHESDISEFREFTEEANDNNETVYLLRYAASDDYYFLSLKGEGLEGNIAMCQETIYLDFDIITLSFKNNKGSITVIPVVSAPTDGFTGIENITPPSLGDSDGDGKVDNLFIRKLIGLIFFVIVIIAIIYFIPKIKRILKGGKSIMIPENIENVNQDNLPKKSWRTRLKEANERRRNNIADYRERRRESLEYKTRVANSKLAISEAKQRSRQLKFQADSYRDENRFSRSQRRSLERESRASANRINRESRARARSIDRYSKHGNKNRNHSRRSRSYNRNNRYRY